MGRASRHNALVCHCAIAKDLCVCVLDVIDDDVDMACGLHGYQVLLTHGGSQLDMLEGVGG